MRHVISHAPRHGEKFKRVEVERVPYFVTILGHNYLCILQVEGRASSFSTDDLGIGGKTQFK